jgi:hypothetical protein
MKIEFKPKLNVEISQSLEKQFTHEADKRKLVTQSAEQKVTISGLRKLYQEIAKFGGIKMAEGQTEIANDGNRKLEQAELNFQKSGYIEKLRQTPESQEIEKFRKNLIVQFNNPIPKN